MPMQLYSGSGDNGRVNRPAHQPAEIKPADRRSHRWGIRRPTVDEFMADLVENSKTNRR